MTGIFTALATCHTIRNAIGFTAAPLMPPVIVESTGPVSYTHLDVYKRQIQKEFHENDFDVFTMEDIKRAYFRLLSDNIISEIIPHAVYNEKDQTYD